MEVTCHEAESNASGFAADERHDIGPERGGGRGEGRGKRKRAANINASRKRAVWSEIVSLQWMAGWGWGGRIGMKKGGALRKNWRT